MAKVVIVVLRREEQGPEATPTTDSRAGPGRLDTAADRARRACIASRLSSTCGPRTPKSVDAGVAEARVVITTAPGEERPDGLAMGRRWGGQRPASTDARASLCLRWRPRAIVRLLTWRSSAQIWCELHERRFVGSAARRRSMISLGSAGTRDRRDAR